MSQLTIKVGHFGLGASQDADTQIAQAIQMLGEQAQRSLAMRSASDNADSMTKKLTRTYNRARQAQITSEMIEIISGSEGGRE